ncbi:MAG: ankyrin repeat domain-containing protein [Candidatus Dependentiae bacterium]|nr:ankyrin repeat domain-containing protein [Candidatus Dependentiae bacterium]
MDPISVMFSLLEGCPSPQTFERGMTIAVNYMDLEEIKEMVAKDKGGKSLETAIKLIEMHGYLELAKMALDKGGSPCDVNLKSKFGLLSPLHVAAFLGRTHYITYFCKKNCDVNALLKEDEEKVAMTPTDLALACNNTRSASKLIRAGGKYTINPFSADMAALIVAFHKVIENKVDDEKQNECDEGKEFITTFLTVNKDDHPFSLKPGVPFNEKMVLRNERHIRKLIYLDKKGSLTTPFNQWVAKTFNQQLKNKNERMEEEIKKGNLSGEN